MLQFLCYVPLILLASLAAPIILVAVAVPAAVLAALHA